MKNKRNLISLFTFLISVFWFGCQEEVDDIEQAFTDLSLLETEEVTLEDVQVCETAYAFGEDPDDCFINNGFSNWGWSIGPLALGDYIFPIYAGAGQCDISKGVLAGTLVLKYVGSEATITFRMNPGYAMDETHLYIGDEQIPKDKKGKPTVAPGQYPYQHDLEGASLDSYTITGLSDRIYVIAHAVVCEGIETCVDDGVVYGIDRGESLDDPKRGDIWLMNIVTGVGTLVGFVYPAALTGAPGDETQQLNSPNGFAYDYDNNRLYYAANMADETSDLWFYDFGSGDNVMAGKIDDVSIPGASYYNGAYYFINSNTDDYYRVDLNPDGTITSTTKVADVRNNTRDLNFGDIAITKDGTFYGSARVSFPGASREHAYAFFTMNLDGTGYGEIYSNGPNEQNRPQIAIGGDGLIYANSGTQYFTLDAGTGKLTATVDGPVNFNDLASGPPCY